MTKLRMSLSLGSLILAGIAAPATSQAQIAVNMSLLTCGQFLAMSPDSSRIYAAWMSGGSIRKRAPPMSTSRRMQETWRTSKPGVQPIQENCS
jgi:hypothetical protein